MNNSFDSSDTTLDVTISGSPSIDAAISLLRSNQDATTVVVTFSGVRIANGNNAGNRPAALFPMTRTTNNTNNTAEASEIIRFFQSLAQSKNVEHLRLEWNIIGASVYEQPPLIPLQALEEVLAPSSNGNHHHTSTTTSNVQSLSLYRIQLAGDARDYERLTQCAMKNSTLQSMRVEFCAPVGSPNLDPFVLSLSRLNGLREFELIGFQGDPSRGCTSASLQALCQESSLETLRTLKIWGGILQSEDQHAVSFMSQALKNNKGITDLELGLFDLDIASAMALGGVLRHNTALERIWLDVDTTLQEETIAPLANAMKDNSHIKSFNIVSTNEQRAGENVLRIFAEMAKANTTLRHMTVRGCNERAMRSQYQTEIDFYLKLNRVGRSRLLGAATTNRLANHLWLRTLSCENNNVSVTYFLLKRNPQFISQYVQSPTKVGKRRNKPVGVEEPRRKRRRLVYCSSTDELR